MNSKLREMLKQLYTTAVQDADGVMAGRKGYRMRYDEVPEQMEKAIRQAVGEEMLELVDSTMVMNRPVDARFAGGESEVRIKLRQKIKEWAALKEPSK